MLQRANSRSHHYLYAEGKDNDFIQRVTAQEERKKLGSALKNEVKAIVMNATDSAQITHNNPIPQCITNILGNRINLFRNGKVQKTTTAIWNLLQEHTRHTNLSSGIQTGTAEELVYKWIVNGLNKSEIAARVRGVVFNTALINQWYKEHAFLLSPEDVTILLSVLETIDALSFSMNEELPHTTPQGGSGTKKKKKQRRRVRRIMEIGSTEKETIQPSIFSSPTKSPRNPTPPVEVEETPKLDIVIPEPQSGSTESPSVSPEPQPILTDPQPIPAVPEPENVAPSTNSDTEDLDMPPDSPNPFQDEEEDSNERNDLLLLKQELQQIDCLFQPIQLDYVSPGIEDTITNDYTLPEPVLETQYLPKPAIIQVDSQTVETPNKNTNYNDSIKYEPEVVNEFVKQDDIDDAVEKFVREEKNTEALKEERAKIQREIEAVKQQLMAEQEKLELIQSSSLKSNSIQEPEPEPEPPASPVATPTQSLASTSSTLSLHSGNSMKSSDSFEMLTSSITDINEFPLDIPNEEDTEEEDEDSEDIIYDAEPEILALLNESKGKKTKVNKRNTINLGRSIPKPKAVNKRATLALGSKYARPQAVKQTWTALRRQLYIMPPPEHTVEMQHRLCAGCGRTLKAGFFTTILFCEYSRRNFCTSCHRKERSMIPARILFNWDFTPYPVSHFYKEFLKTIMDEPLFNFLAVIKPELFARHQELAQVRQLLNQIKALKDYVYTCKHSNELLKLIEGRRHLAETCFVSMQDLFDIRRRKLVHFLRDVTSKWAKHVFSCDICKQRGAFCEICKGNDVIYSFQLKLAKSCEKCKAIYHKACYRGCCPKCIRIQKRRKTKGPSIENGTGV